jgi:hypothetical protein
VETKPGLDVVPAPVWSEVLTHLEDAVLVLDAERTLRFANPRARALLGYREGESIGGRCRSNTRGIDCENACPLTFALESRLDRVEDFATVYHTRDGRPLPLSVTLIPLRDAAGDFCGAVEILRPAELDPGFYLAGSSRVASELRGIFRQAAMSSRHLAVSGDPLACADVARGVHRMSGVDDSLYHVWTGSWDRVDPWPPGTMYVNGGPFKDASLEAIPKGWRLIVKVADLDDVSEVSGFERVQLPNLPERCDDLAEMIAAWIRQRRPALAISPEVLDRLVRMARDGGLERVDRVLSIAIPAAVDRLDLEHLPVNGYAAELVDEILRDPDPFGALEMRLLREVLCRSDWRVQDAADRLGVSRTTLWRKMRDHGIERPGCANGGD